MKNASIVVQNLVRTAALNMKKTFPYVELEDLQQEGLAFVFEKFGENFFFSGKLQFGVSLAVIRQSVKKKMLSVVSSQVQVSAWKLREIIKGGKVRSLRQDIRRELPALKPYLSISSAVWNQKDPYEMLDHLEAYSLAHFLIENKCSPKEQDVYIMHLAGLTKKEMAEVVGCSEERITEIMTKATRRLRKSSTRIEKSYERVRVKDKLTGVIDKYMSMSKNAVDKYPDNPKAMIEHLYPLQYVPTPSNAAIATILHPEGLDFQIRIDQAKNYLASVNELRVLKDRHHIVQVQIGSYTIYLLFFYASGFPGQLSFICWNTTDVNDLDLTTALARVAMPKIIETVQYL